MRSLPHWLTVVAVLLASTAVFAEDPPYRVQGGDTLWDLSERFWNDPTTWPELWARNPQIYNPHRVFPGEPVWLDCPEGARQVIHLPVVRLEPEAGGRDEVGTTGAGGGEPSAMETAAFKRLAATLPLGRPRVQDFLSSHRLPRLGRVDNSLQEKTIYSVGEDVRVVLEPGASLAVGERVSFVDDATPVVHPVTGMQEGYRVDVLGHGVVRDVFDGFVRVNIVAANGVVDEGGAVVAFLQPVWKIVLKEAPVPVDGVILTGQGGQSVYSQEEVVFLDRGKLHGLEPGVVLEVPVTVAARSAEGLVDLRAPLARLAVVSVQDKFASCLVFQSRMTIKAGDRVVTASFSP